MIRGIVKDKNNIPLQDVLIELKQADFVTRKSTKTDENGNFIIDNERECFQYLTAVKEYGNEYLEYWCQNIRDECNLDITIGRLEIYGMHAFIVEGAYDSIMVYFRPMSLDRYLSGEENICPVISKMVVWIDGKEAEVIMENKVKEASQSSFMDAYLIQIKRKENISSKCWKTIDIIIYDQDGNCGAAKLIR